MPFLSFAGRRLAHRECIDGGVRVRNNARDAVEVANNSACHTEFRNYLPGSRAPALGRAGATPGRLARRGAQNRRAASRWRFDVEAQVPRNFEIS